MPLPRIKRAASRLFGPSHDEKVRRANAEHDMARDPDETFYREQYLHWLAPELEKLNLSRRLRILDLGCGHGRVSLAAAKLLPSSRVVGVDFSQKSLNAAREYARQEKLTNVEFVDSDLMAYLTAAASESFDVIVCTEVLYNVQSYLDAVRRIHSLLTPGGLLFLSLRTRWFDLLKSVRARDFKSARMVRDRREGYWGGGTVWSAWHTVADVKRILAESGFEPPTVRGIGVLSGVADDPMSAIARPSILSDADRRELLELELSLSEELADQGRYILAITRKRQP